MTRTRPPHSGHKPARLARGVRGLVRRALAEDRARTDRTTRALLDRSVAARADVVAQSACVVSGLSAAASTARALGVRVREMVHDGDRVPRGRVVLKMEGDARSILAAERTLLNLLMHLSGVATATAEAVKHAGSGAGGMAVYGTRKTLPGLRDLEKAAVVHGGGFPHRRDLSDGVLLKNNHLALVPMAAAVARVRRKVGPRALLQVEVRDEASAVAAVRAGANALLIDNASPQRVRRIIGGLEGQRLRRGIWVEVSGGITPANVGRYRSSGADAASSGALTHSAPAMPFHLVLTARHPVAPASPPV